VTTTERPAGETSAGRRADEGASSGQRVADWFDGRLGIHSLGRRYLRKVFPDHWSLLLGEICLYSFVVLILTGVYLTLFFHPSMNEVTYQGSYVPLNGVQMSEAYASTLDISFDVRGGLLIRQMHHWAALIFIAGMLMHMMRHFFTGSFRKPREVNWLSLRKAPGTLGVPFGTTTKSRTTRASHVLAPAAGRVVAGQA
jgi:ubiquinol-cytochrome c reductase cytochrome b subunit